MLLALYEVCSTSHLSLLISLINVSNWEIVTTDVIVNFGFCIQIRS